MNYFLCMLDPWERGITDDVCRRFEALPRTRGLKFEWQRSPRMAVLTAWDDPYGPPTLVATDRPGGWSAVGNVRLDNRLEAVRWAPKAGAGTTDLELVRSVIAVHGTRYVPRLLGDFGFIAWNGITRTAVGACDAFAVHRLYYSEQNGLVIFASRAEALATGNDYDLSFLAALVTEQPTASGLTVYTGVRLVPRASMIVIQPGHPTRIQEYWRATDYSVDSSWATAEQEAISTCRRLVMDSVRLRAAGRDETWAQLSGGIDSSTVVSCAQWLAAHGEGAGLAGTVTFVDRQGTGTDERDYSDAVGERWGVPNAAIVNPPTWYDESYDPPHLDQPSCDLPIYPRDMRLCAIVREAGGRVLLTGSGGDQLFSGTMLYFADWVAHGHIRIALREMARRAAIGRVSFWELAYRNALLPLLPRSFHARLVHDQNQSATIPWLDHQLFRKLALDTQRAATASAYGGRLGHSYEYAVRSLVGTIMNHYHGGVIADALEIRHPFLYRPLVEFALRLPPELRARPHAHRWVLRQAMAGILPERVRTRVGKPSTGDFLAWSLMTEREHLEPLTHEPVLADLGLIDPGRLRAAFNDTLQRQQTEGNLCEPLLNTLSVEAWLRIRSGRWPFCSKSRS